MELCMEHITKKFKDMTAVDDISLEISPGVWGLLGANGAGKTTLMRMIAGIMKPSSGQILYDGIPIEELKEGYRDIFGYLPQEFGFYPEFTVKDYLEYVSVLKGLTAKDSRRRIDELLEQLTLSHVRNKKIVKLSGGMKRRVGIAQALLNEPEILILDEPTSGLDPLMQREFYSLLKERNEEGATVFLSSHILSEVQRYCRHAAVIREGRLLAYDSVENLGHADAKRVTLRCTGNGSVQGHMEHLKALLGQNDHRAGVPERIKNVDAAGDGVSFLYSGEPGLLLKALSELSLADITIAEPDLEEVFMHYYEGGNGQ